jgi:hypothetical protein
MASLPISSCLHSVGQGDAQTSSQGSLHKKEGLDFFEHRTKIRLVPKAGSILRVLDGRKEVLPEVPKDLATRVRCQVPTVRD